jgi:hypothetical protein
VGASIVNSFGGGLKVFEIAAHQGYVCARFRESSRYAASDAGAAAGNECHPARKNSVHEDFVSHICKRDAKQKPRPLGRAPIFVDLSTFVFAIPKREDAN